MLSEVIRELWFLSTGWSSVKTLSYPSDCPFHGFRERIDDYYCMMNRFWENLFHPDSECRYYYGVYFRGTHGLDVSACGLPMKMISRQYYMLASNVLYLQRLLWMLTKRDVWLWRKPETITISWPELKLLVNKGCLGYTRRWDRSTGDKSCADMPGLQHEYDTIGVKISGHLINHLSRFRTIPVK